MELQTKIGRQIEYLLSKNESIYGRLTNKSAENGCDILYVDFTPTSLCQYRMYDIKNTEPLIIYLSERSRPIVYSNREDFPLTSHQNSERELCLFDVTYEELKHSLDGSFLLRQIDDWLCKTSSNELHDTTQPIEPYFMNTDNMMVFDDVKKPLLFLYSCKINGRNYSIQQKQETSASISAIRVHFNIDVEADNIIRPLPLTLNELLEHFPGCDFEGEILKTILVAEQEAKEIGFPMSNARILVTLLIKKAIANRNESEFRCILTKMNIGQIRPLLVMNIAQPKSRNLSNIEVEHFSYCHAFDKEHASLYNGIYDHPAVKTKILQIGVGAIGSQLLNNCVKAGFGYWTFIDKDIFLPHNTARHKIDVGNYGSFKSDILANWLRLMYKGDEAKRTNISYTIDVLDSKNKETVDKAIQETDIILDTAASSAVSKSLAIDHDHNKRIISFFMNPSGKSAIALIEDKKRDFRLDYIEYEYFKRLIDIPIHENHFERTEKVYYSASCRDSSAIISQDSVAVFSALCSKKLKNALTSDHAEVIIWTEEDDSITIDKFVPSRYVNRKLNDENGTLWNIFISSDVENEIEELRLAAGNVETGGILLGGVDKFRNIIYIVKNLPAPDDSIHAPMSYVRGCKGLPKKMEKVNRLTSNMISYIGEWHSHLNADTNKSDDDIILHDSIKDFTSNNCSPAVMIIVGNDGYSLYI